MNESVSNFYCKENNPLYLDKYNREHGKRLDFVFDHFKLGGITHARIVDFGGANLYFIKKFDKTNYRLIIDGAQMDRKHLEKEFGIKYFRYDLNEPFSLFNQTFDIATAFEVIEHLSNPYQLVLSMKKLCHPDGMMFISIPHEKTTHNTIYTGLFYPETNFEEFLGQMACPIVEKVYSEHSFPSWIYQLQNKPWSEKKMKWPKPDAKYRDVSPLELTNL